MNKAKINDIIRDEKNIIDCDISYRGGTLKIDASELFPGYCEKTGGKAIVGASQNYLGGGIAAAITGGAMFLPEELNKKERKIFDDVLKACKLYFYELNNGGGDEYIQENFSGQDVKHGYLKNQSLPASYPGL